MSSLKSSRLYANKIDIIFEIRMFSFTFWYLRLLWQIYGTLLKNTLHGANVYNFRVDLAFGNSQKLLGVSCQLSEQPGKICILIKNEVCHNW